MGEVYDRQIEEKIRAAKVVVVLWSHQSVVSRWVREEADLASKLGKLIPISIDGTKPPIGFLTYATLHLKIDDKKNLEQEPNFQHLIHQIMSLTGGEIQPSVKSPHLNRIDPVSSVETDRIVMRYRCLASAWRTHIFIAHASSDKPRIKPIVELLIAQGFKIWIDKPHELNLKPSVEGRLSRNRVRHDADWPEQIRLAAFSSDVVLGFWSREALQGDRRQFNYELYMGLIQGKLRLCRFDSLTEVEIGYPYSFIQMANITDYKPNVYHPELDYLMRDITKKAILGFL